MSIRTLYRIVLAVCIMNALTTIVVAVYYQFYRPEWADPKLWQDVGAVLRNPATPDDTVRKLAVAHHELIENSLLLGESALDMALIICGTVAIFLGYVAYALRCHYRAQQNVL